MIWGDTLHMKMPAKLWALEERTKVSRDLRLKIKKSKIEKWAEDKVERQTGEYVESQKQKRWTNYPTDYSKVFMSIDF